MFVAAALVLLQSGDIVYFGYVGRHLADELTHLGNDPRYLVSEAFIGHPLAFGCTIVGLVALITCYFWCIRPKADATSLSGKGRWLSVLLCLLFVVAGVRGTFGLKPLGVVNAYSFEKASAGHLALNGVFTAWHASGSFDEESPVGAYSADKLARILAPLELSPSSPYPLLHKFNSDKKGNSVSPAPSHPNIVLVIFESFGAFYVDSFHTGSLEKFGATPNFDALAHDGVRYSHFYANGSRSIEAMQNILTSFPSLRSLPTLGSGYEQASVSSLARVLRESGYHTLFAQSAPRGSFRLDAIAKALGFQDYYGAEDYPPRLDYHGERAPQFGWDTEMFLHVADKIKELPEPFLAVVFTGSAHTPFAKPPDVALRSGHGPDNEPGFLDLMAYSDKSLGRFMDALKKDDSGRFARSIFALTADHMFPPYRNFNLDEMFRVPFLLYGPAFLAPGEMTRIGSHLDIMPTLLTLSGYSGEAATAGRPLPVAAGDKQSHSSFEFAFLAGRYGTPALVTRQAILPHSLQKRLDPFLFEGTPCNEPCLARMEEQLLAYHQLLYQCFRSNRIMPTVGN